MARTNLSAMLDRLEEAAPDPAPEQESTHAADKPPAPVTARHTPKPRAVVDPAPIATAGYRSFERKETRLREDQYALLTREARRLNRAKGPGGDRITENTLIRVAIDLLLAHPERLVGASEPDILKSVTS